MVLLGREGFFDILLQTAIVKDLHRLLDSMSIVRVFDNQAIIHLRIATVSIETPKI